MRISESKISVPGVPKRSFGRGSIALSLQILDLLRIVFDLLVRRHLWFTVIKLCGIIDMQIAVIVRLSLARRLMYESGRYGRWIRIKIASPDNRTPQTYGAYCQQAHA